MKLIIPTGILAALITQTALSDEYLGNYSANKSNANSTSNPHGAGSPYNANSINNPNGTYGSPHSSKSANNPYGAGSPYR